MKNETIREMHETELLPSQLIAGWNKAHKTEIISKFKRQNENKVILIAALLMFSISSITALFMVIFTQKTFQVDGFIFLCVISQLCAWIIIILNERKSRFTRDLYSLKELLDCDWKKFIALREINYGELEEEVKKILIDSAHSVLYFEWINGSDSEEAIEARKVYKETKKICRAFDLVEVKDDLYYQLAKEIIIEQKKQLKEEQKKEKEEDEKVAK